MMKLERVPKMCALILPLTKSLHSAPFNQCRTISVRKSKTTVFPCRATTQHDIVDRLAKLHVNRVFESSNGNNTPTTRKDICSDTMFLKEAYERCRIICAHNATTFYLGSLLLPEERKKAIWAIYAWCMRMDEIMDGPNGDYTSSDELEEWEGRLKDIFNGCPYDLLDAALADTIDRFSLDIKPFQDLIEGMKMDMLKTKYENYEELQLYCYYVAGTMSLVCVRILGISSESSSVTTYHNIYKAALNLAIGTQLINILRDVVEDYALRGRIYLPQNELKEFGLTNKDISSRKVTEQWREFMKKQIARARAYFKEAEKAASPLDGTSKWAVWASLLLYQKILDKIESNNYDNLRKRASVGIVEKLLTLPLAYAKAKGFL